MERPEVEASLTESKAEMPLVDFFIGLAGLPDEVIEQKILQLQDAMLNDPGFDPDSMPPVVNHFSPEIYMREIFMPAGTFIIGARHKTEHYNIILTGSALVLMEGELVRVTAPQIILSKAGVKKTLIILEDMRWVTVHSNPSNITDMKSLEAMCVDEPIAEVHDRIRNNRKLEANK